MSAVPPREHGEMTTAEVIALRQSVGKAIGADPAMLGHCVILVQDEIAGDVWSTLTCCDAASDNLGELHQRLAEEERRRRAAPQN